MNFGEFRDTAPLMKAKTRCQFRGRGGNNGELFTCPPVPSPDPPPPYFLSAVVVFLPIALRQDNRMAVNNLLGITAVKMHYDASDNCDISSHDMNTRISI